jgi:hypothetical protein
MRFEVISAFVVGSLLPVLETVRRGIDHWAVSFTTMFEDYVAGSFLLISAFVSVRSKPYALPLLLASWAYATGMMSSSFWYQLESTIRGVGLEANNSMVLAIKAILWSTCVMSLACCFRQSLAKQDRRGA